MIRFKPYLYNFKYCSRLKEYKRNIKINEKHFSFQTNENSLSEIEFVFYLKEWYLWNINTQNIVDYPFTTHLKLAFENQWIDELDFWKYYKPRIHTVISRVRKTSLLIWAFAKSCLYTRLFISFSSVYLAHTFCKYSYFIHKLHMLKFCNALRNNLILRFQNDSAN